MEIILRELKIETGCYKVDEERATVSFLLQAFSEPEARKQVYEILGNYAELINSVHFDTSYEKLDNWHDVTVELVEEL